MEVLIRLAAFSRSMPGLAARSVDEHTDPTLVFSVAALLAFQPMRTRLRPNATTGSRFYIQ